MKKVWIFVVIIILLLGGYLVYSKTDIKDKLNNKKDTDINNNINTEDEKALLSKEIENFIGNTSNRQIFVMQQILKDENNNSNFIILDSEGKDSNEKMSPSDEYVMAYYPYDLFNQEYKKYFSDNFDIDNRVVSSLNTKYDKDKKYVYYENKKIGLNGINVTSMDITSVSYDSNTKTYTSFVKINYSDRASELMKIDSSNGIIKYTRSNNNLYLESFEINK